MNGSTRVVFGLGTGRCGTATLAALIELQAGGCGGHERLGHRVAWQGGEREVDVVLRMLEDELASGVRLIGEVGFYYLPYLARIRARFPAARFIVLQRERAATIASFLDKTVDKANHWAPTPRFARHARWSRCFPTYPAGLDKAAAIGRYWDQYYAATATLERAEPEVFMTVGTERLGEIATQHAILDFLGLPRGDQMVDAGLQRNRTSDVRQSFGKRLRRWWRRLKATAASG